MRTPEPHWGRLLLGFQGWLPSRGPGAHQGGAGEKAQTGCRLATLKVRVTLRPGPERGGRGAQAWRYACQPLPAGAERGVSCWGRAQTQGHRPLSSPGTRWMGLCSGAWGAPPGASGAHGPGGHALDLNPHKPPQVAPALSPCQFSFLPANWVQKKSSLGASKSFTYFWHLQIKASLQRCSHCPVSFVARRQVASSSLQPHGL